MSGLGTAPFLTEGRTGDTPLHRLDPRAKIVGLVVLTVIIVTTPAAAAWAFILYAAVLLFLVGLARLRLSYVLKRLLVVLPILIVVAIFLPFFDQAGTGSYSLGGAHVTTEGLLVLWNVGAKAILGVLSMIVLGATTGFAGMVSGFERLHVPRVFLLVVSFMYRYSFVFVDEARRMQRALASRNYRARWLWNAPILGYMLGALFLRSYARGERVYVAMLSRGYDGTVSPGEGVRFGRREVAFVSVVIGFALIVRLAASLGGVL